MDRKLRGSYAFLAWVVMAGVQLGLAMYSPCVLADEEDVPSSLKQAPATHKQVSIVSVANTAKGEKLEDFCVDSKGRILALLGPANNAGIPVPTLTNESREKFDCAIHVYEADGKLVAKWPVGFSGQAINTAPDGTVVVGGDGRVARFDADGKKLAEGESPQMSYINNNPEEMRERAKEQLEADRATYTEQVKQFEEQLKQQKDAKGKAQPAPQDEDDSAATEEAGALQVGQLLTFYRQHLETLKKQTVEQTLEQVLSRAKRTHAITASDKDVFVSCAAMAGYGFGIWRTDSKFGEPKEIVKSLSGCCGQMDVQCLNGDLYVCENSRHRVVRFSREGKELAQFGKRDRVGEGEGFGGCCNPMNLCFSKQGNLYVSESNGVVKHFTPEGKYLGIVGIAAVQPGCKNSCVGATANDSKLFYIDVQKSQIIVLDRIDAVSAK